MAPLLGGRTSVIAEVLRQAQGRQSVTDEMAEPDRDPSTGGCRQLRPGHHRCWQYWLHDVSRSNQPRRVTRHDQPVAARSPKIALQTCLCWWMENRIKRHKSQLASDRTSCRSPLANQMRLILHTAAYWLMLTIRATIPRVHPLAKAEFATIRLRLLKLAAHINETATRVRIAFAAACPQAELFHSLANTLCCRPP